VNSDAILIMGSSMAENHPVGFQWVIEAREKGAKIIHVDPRFNRTSAMADVWAPLRAGSDIVLLGGLIHYVLDNEKDFRDYVVNYTNASIILRDDFQDTEDLDGVFSGWNGDKNSYDTDSWAYKGSPLKKDAAKHGASGGHAQDRGGEKLEDSVYERDVTLQNPRCVYQILKRHFSRYTPEVVEQACGVSPDRGNFLFCIRSGEDGRDLLCGGLDATFGRRTNHSMCSDSANVTGQHWATGWRDSGAAGSCVDPRVDRYSDTFRHPAGIPADAGV
jgi:formate dehydrogenase major subunit